MKFLFRRGGKTPGLPSARGDDREKTVRSDVLGSYTGAPLDDDEPVQDADDL